MSGIFIWVQIPVLPWEDSGGPISGYVKATIKSFQIRFGIILSTNNCSNHFIVVANRGLGGYIIRLK